MADNIVGGLFGVDPAQLQQQRMTQDLKEGFMLAQLSPMDRATAGIYAGSKQLGRAGQSLLGMEDPQLQEAAMAKKLSENFDVNSVSGLRGLAAELQKAGSLRYSQLAAQQANQLEASAITRGLNLRKTETEGNQLAWIGVDGQPDMKQQAVVDKATGAIIRRVGDPISVVTSRATSTVNLPAGESEFVKQLGKDDAKTVTKAMETRGNAISTLQSLEKLESLNNQQLISGTFATGRVGAANFLNTIGLASSADVSRISSSQQYDKVAKDVIFQTLGGKLGAGFSNEDRKFIEALIPQLETSADARRKLIEYMRGKQQLIADESTRLENYARSNRGLGGFEYKIPRETLAPAGSATKPEFTREQLEAEIKRRERK
jgi:hypothetical protein